jgi:hypothetical protein
VSNDQEKKQRGSKAKGEGKEQINVHVVTAIQVSSEDDYSDRMLESKDCKQEERELRELQLACEETYSLQGDYYKGVHGTPGMGFVDPREVRQKPPGRRGKTKVWAARGTGATTVDMPTTPALPLLSGGEVCTSEMMICVELETGNAMEGVSETWPLDFASRRSLRQWSNYLPPFVTDCLEKEAQQQEGEQECT